MAREEDHEATLITISVSVIIIYVILASSMLWQTIATET